MVSFFADDANDNGGLGFLSWWNDIVNSSSSIVNTPRVVGLFVDGGINNILFSLVLLLLLLLLLLSVVLLLFVLVLVVLIRGVDCIPSLLVFVGISFSGLAPKSINKGSL